ncbi:MAG: hypothetical protein PWP08_1259 [Methanofollis sp.]|nr:hypothetical protein [Methanofollis sp.]
MDALVIGDTDLSSPERAGAVYLNPGRYAEATEYYDRMVTLKPDPFHQSSSGWHSFHSERGLSCSFFVKHKYRVK